jgi:hypothetical protein
MMLIAKMRAWTLGIDPDQAKFSRLGFHDGEAHTRVRLEQIAGVFIHGFNTALLETGADRLAQSLDNTTEELRGFAFEGSSMGLALIDCLTPWRRQRFSAFVAGSAARHNLVAYIGAGLALARLRLGVDAFINRTDRVLGWFAADGYGFHEGFFRTDQTIRCKQVPKAMHGYASRAFDQGLGRSLWFIHCADAVRIADCIDQFASPRRSHLWSGVGLACAYAGGASESTIVSLRTRAGAYRHHMAQGAAFAALARQQGGNPSPLTEMACALLCGRSAHDAANLAKMASRNLPLDCEIPGFEVWRRRVQHQLGLAWIRGSRATRFDSQAR